MAWVGIVAEMYLSTKNHQWDISPWTFVGAAMAVVGGLMR